MHSMLSKNTVMLHVPCHNGSRYAGERVMGGDLSFKTETIPSFQYSVQDVKVYLLQEPQRKDFLAVMKQSDSRLQKKYQVMNRHILKKKW